MPRNIVLSPFSYVAYELCLKLMENGQDVIGIEPSLSCIDKEERDEKELYVGRNANWHLHSLGSASFSSYGESILYVCHVNADWPVIQDFLLEHKGELRKIVYISSASAQPFIDILKWSKSNVWIQLPSIYGPWQLEDSFFERLAGGSFPFEEYEKEDRRDVLYIDDAVNAILDIAELKDGAYQLHSGVENHWHQVLKEFGYRIIYESNNVQDGRILEECKQQIHYANAQIKPDQGVEMIRRHKENLKKRNLFL